MPEEPEVETKELEETIEELREERAEREEEARQTAWTRYISLSTAVLAVVAALAALQAGTLVNEALIVKNEAVLHQAQASDQWAYYQAKGLKGNGAKQTADILASNPAQEKAAEKWKAEAERYKQDQEEIQKKAKDLEEKRNAKNEESEALMHQHHQFAICVTFTQVAIALSAIAALTKRKVVWYISMMVGLAGIIWFVGGFLQKSAHTTAEGPAAHIESK